MKLVSVLVLAVLLVPQVVAECPSAKGKSAMSFTMAARILMEKGETAGAQNCFQDAVDVDSENSYAWTGLAEAQKKLGHFEQALLACARATSLTPNVAIGWVHMGDVLKVLDREDDAIECYERAVSLSPNSSSAHEKLATAYGDIGNEEEAMKHFELAMKLQVSGGGTGDSLAGAGETAPPAAKAGSSGGHSADNEDDDDDYDDDGNDDDDDDDNSLAGRNSRVVYAIVGEAKSGEIISVSIPNEGEIRAVAHTWASIAKVSPSSADMVVILDSLDKISEDEVPSALKKVYEAGSSGASLYVLGLDTKKLLLPLMEKYKANAGRKATEAIYGNSGRQNLLWFEKVKHDLEVAGFASLHDKSGDSSDHTLVVSGMVNKGKDSSSKVRESSKAKNSGSPPPKNAPKASSKSATKSTSKPMESREGATGDVSVHIIVLGHERPAGFLATVESLKNNLSGQESVTAIIQKNKKDAVLKGFGVARDQIGSDIDYMEVEGSELQASLLSILESSSASHFMLLGEGSIFTKAVDAKFPAVILDKYSPLSTYHLGLGKDLDTFLVVEPHVRDVSDEVLMFDFGMFSRYYRGVPNPWSWICTTEGIVISKERLLHDWKKISFKSVSAIDKAWRDEEYGKDFGFVRKHFSDAESRLVVLHSPEKSAAESKKLSEKRQKLDFESMVPSEPNHSKYITSPSKYTSI